MNFKTVDQAARELGVTKGKVMSWIRLGQIKAEMVGKFYLIPIKEIEKRKKAKG
jgi:excisionase family DNA binding protein